MASGGAANPSSWNRYAYVEGDPVNFMDRQGLQTMWAPEPLPPPPAPTPPLPQLVPMPGPGPEPQDLPPDPTYENVAGVHQVIGFKAAQDLLAKKDCYEAFGFKSKADAQASFANVTFRYTNAGRMIVDRVDGELRQRSGPGLPTVATAYSGTRVVALNLDAGYLNPDTVAVVEGATGNTLYVDLRASASDQLKATLSLQQWQSLVLLHEFKHILGAPQESDPAAYNKPIYENCIK